MWWWFWKWNKIATRRYWHCWKPFFFSVGQWLCTVLSILVGLSWIWRRASSITRQLFQKWRFFWLAIWPCRQSRHVDVGFDILLFFPFLASIVSKALFLYFVVVSSNCMAIRLWISLPSLWVPLLISRWWSCQSVRFWGCYWSLWERGLRWVLVIKWLYKWIIWIKFLDSVT